MQYEVTMNRYKVNFAQRHVCKCTGLQMSRLPMPPGASYQCVLYARWPWFFLSLFSFGIALLWNSPVICYRGKGLWQMQSHLSHK
jgi:hypothetical protein